MMSRVIDVHVHLTPPEIAGNRERFLAGEGAWAQIYRDPKARMATTDDLLAAMDGEGVDVSLVMGFPWSNEDTAKRHNEWLLEQAARHPSRLKPLAAFDALAPWAPRHAESMLRAGMAGLGELALYDRGFGPAELEALGALGELCGRENRLFLMHVNEPIGHQYPGKAPLEIGQIHALAQGCQNVKLILAHFGGGLPFFAALKKEVKNYFHNIFFDTAAMPFLFDPAALPMALKILGPEHFLLGTDFPLLKTSRYRKYFAEAGLAPEIIAQIMGSNAEKLLEM
ncbi:MAG: amidohydrolase [Candidatus Adiutrix sp.]|jgi:predicted TIM-barrel fold metal-dependent hydrolase|nr:amidohydrolase [Candidatus Adiutrix sp.]